MAENTEPMHPRFTQSGPFAAFLETMQIDRYPDDNMVTMMWCTECGNVVCDVDPEDTLAVLVLTALKHDEVCSARRSTEQTEDTEGGDSE